MCVSVCLSATKPVNPRSSAARIRIEGDMTRCMYNSTTILDWFKSTALNRGQTRVYKARSTACYYHMLPPEKNLSGLRSRRYGYVLPICQYSFCKNYFISRCLFRFFVMLNFCVWFVFLVFTFFIFFFFFNICVCHLLFLLTKRYHHQHQMPSTWNRCIAWVWLIYALAHWWPISTINPNDYLFYLFLLWHSIITSTWIHRVTVM